MWQPMFGERSAADVPITHVTNGAHLPTFVSGPFVELFDRHLGDLWIGLRAAVRGVMESVTLADLLAGDLPAEVQALVDDPDAWRSGTDR